MKIIDLKRELKLRGLKVTGNRTALAERLQSDVIMNLREPKVAKRKKLDHCDGECSAEESPGLLDMPIEIIERIFDYLDIGELIAISQTCKWIQQVAHRCYQQNYAGLFPRFKKIEISGIISIFRLGYEPTFIDAEPFIPLFDKISICRYKNTKEESLYKFIDQQSQFHRLKQLTIREMDFTNLNIDKMKGVLSKLEYLEIDRCKTNDEFLENLLSLTPKIKRLYLNYIHTENRWLERNYPTLEHCEIVSETFVPITVLLTHNPNIRKFGTNLINLWKNIIRMKADKINLEHLAIAFNDDDHLDDIHLRSFWRLLDEHHQSGIYKRLHLHYDCFCNFNQKIVDGIAISTGVDRFYVGKHFRVEGVALSEMNFLANIGDFTFPDSRFIKDIETVATKLESLKRIHFKTSTLSDVKVFIGGNSNLEEIQIDNFMDEVGRFEYFKVFNLIELNKERAKLPKAKKITLFVKEPVYLITKRANRETELEFIKLKRKDTLIERHFDFGYPTLY